LPLTVGILTGCTSLVTTYERIRATLTEPEADQTIHRYGAWLLTPAKGHAEHQDLSPDTGWKPIIKEASDEYGHSKSY
jgi:hypothetical protein